VPALDAEGSHAHVAGSPRGGTLFENNHLGAPLAAATAAANPAAHPQQQTISASSLLMVFLLIYAPDFRLPLSKFRLLANTPPKTHWRNPEPEITLQAPPGFLDCCLLIEALKHPLEAVETPFHLRARCHGPAPMRKALFTADPGTGGLTGTRVSSITPMPPRNLSMAIAPSLPETMAATTDPVPVTHRRMQRCLSETSGAVIIDMNTTAFMVSNWN